LLLLTKRHPRSRSQLAAAAPASIGDRTAGAGPTAAYMHTPMPTRMLTATAGGGAACASATKH